MAQPSRNDAERSFLEQLRDALDHLYDYAALEHHPLQQALGLATRPAGRGKALQQYLTDAIGALRPVPDIPQHAPAWRAYRLLALRYIEAQTSAQVAGQLGIGDRQLRRDHTSALTALANALRPDLIAEGGESAMAQAAEDDDVIRIGKAPLGSGTDLLAVIEGVQTVVSRLALQRKVALAIDVSTGIPTVRVNAVALRQVLISTLSFLIDSYATVSLSVMRRASATLLHLDGANGSAQVSQERLQVGQQLIEMQGGTMACEQQDHGLRVSIELPLQPAVTVLVIDDNPDIARLFQRYLAPISGRVVGASHADEALRLVHEQQPELIVLDVMMPMQDGWELLQLFRNRPETQALPIIICSVLKEHDLALSLGANAFLPKPVSQAALLATIERWRTPPPDQNG
jgi:CheY-like chemotaxis protein